MEESHMQTSDQPPTYSQLHDSQIPNLPSVPKTELPPIHPERTLPPLPPSFPEQSYRASDPIDHKYQQTTPWPSANPLSVYYQPGSQTSPSMRSTIGVDSPSTMEIDVSTPDSRGRRAGSVLSIDDPDVRLAAEALGDLRAADYVQSPPPNHSSLPNSQRIPPQPEPLLSLLTTSHPLIGNAIGNSLSAYSASKNYSPRFKSSAEYMERRITPVVNTVGSVGRMTGVEGSVRWFLGGSARKGNSAANDQGSHKRRKVGEDVEMANSSDDPSIQRQDFQLQHRERRASQSSTVESLPAYDEHRSPSYEASPQQALIPTDSPANQGSTWQSRLMLSTSGLSVAMSEESLRSLKYCLSWLRWANDHIGKVIEALKTLLDQYDSSLSSNSAGSITAGENANSLVVQSEADRAALTTRMGELKSDILKTLKDVIDVVSKYAGGALPENARILVKRHLTSLPQRFRIATRSSGTGANGELEVRDGAKRVLVLAKEGLDMMSQISGVLDGTIVSAEEWCDRLGRKNRSEPEMQDASKEPLPPPVTAPQAVDIKPSGNVGTDVKMEIK